VYSPPYDSQIYAESFERMPAPTIIMVTVLPGAIMLGLLAWSAVRIIRTLLKRQPIQAFPCLVIAFVLALTDLAVSIVYLVYAGLSHSEAAKQKVYYYWMVLFVVIVVLPSIGLYLLHRWSKRYDDQARNV